MKPLLEYLKERDFKKAYEAYIDAARTGNRAIVWKFLEKYPKAVDYVPTNGRTALMEAAASGHIPVAKLLLERGAAINAASSIGWTPLFHAAVNEQTGMIAFL